MELRDTFARLTPTKEVVGHAMPYMYVYARASDADEEDHRTRHAQIQIILYLPPMRNLYLGNRFFYALAFICVLFVLAFRFGWLLPVAQLGLIVVFAATLTDILLNFRGTKAVAAERQLPRVLSLGDENALVLELYNPNKRAVRFGLIDELPFQLQRRDFFKNITLQADERRELRYTIRPVERGEYGFGNLILLLDGPLQLVRRRVIVPAETSAPVYPSILQMKNMELRAFQRITTDRGIKKMRRIGHSYEFEQIKNYVRGDDYRSINWKATGRHNRLMINQYQDERSQQVYSIIDKSRSMKMPFNGLSLMDYAVNSTLVISNIILRKQDKAGLITFSDRIGTTIRADRKPGQLHRILNALYKETQRPLEANYELLYHIARKLIHGRSLVMLYTNFESMGALERVLPILRRMNRIHLLVVVFFVNTEIEEFSNQPVRTMEGIYTQTIARKFLAEKRQMQQLLRQHGIQTILTAPEELSVNTVNKYLELKARGLI